MRRSVCPFVCLRMIRSVRFQVCVFSSAQERSSEQLTLFPVAMVKAHLLTAHLPACFIRNFMHAFGQLGDNASQFPAASKNFSPACKLVSWNYRFSYPEWLFCVLWKPFENFPFFTLSLWSVGELLVDVRTFETQLLKFFCFIYSQPASVLVNRNTSPMRCEGGPV